jgi:hypothetical protein
VRRDDAPDQLPADIEDVDTVACRRPKTSFDIATNAIRHTDVNHAESLTAVKSAVGINVKDTNVCTT